MVYLLVAFFIVIALFVIAAIIRGVFLFPLSVCRDGWKRGVEDYAYELCYCGVFLVFSIWVAWWFYVGHWLIFIPTGMTVSWPLYQNEESWGWGPGGNETGIAAYELPEHVARQIQRQDIEYFAALPHPQRDPGDWHGRYERWEMTPIPADDRWSSGEGATTVAPANRIQNYLNRYGFSIDVDPAIERDIDDAISKPGSFFSYGRIGILIVVPSQRRVYYAFNG